jgi:hypothetical protein
VEKAAMAVEVLSTINVSMQQFIANVQGNQERATKMSCC